MTEQQNNTPLMNQLSKNVQTWERPESTPLHCFSFYNYYHSGRRGINELDKDVQQFVYQFKENPWQKANTFHHEFNSDLPANIVIELMTKRLISSFGENVKSLTLVCIPASTEKRNQMRYERFSNTLCNSLHMSNGFSHTHFEKEGTPKHLSFYNGGYRNATFSFDKEFFNGKSVILFDDIITSGKSMERFRQSLSECGASVICGISIARTRHDYVFQPIRNYNGQK